MPTRRRFLAASSLAVVIGAGCLGGSLSGGSADAGPDGDGNDADDDESAERTADSNAASDEVLFTVTDGDEEVELATVGDVESVGDVQESRRVGYHVPITLTDEGADAFAEGLETIGAFEDPPAHEVRTHLDGEVIYTAKLGTGLAASIESGEWDGDMRLVSDSRETAEEMKNALEDEQR